MVIWLFVSHDVGVGMRDSKNEDICECENGDKYFNF